MTRRRQLARALVLALAATLATAPTVQAAQARRDGAETYTFAFQDADIAQVVQEVLGQVGQPYTIDPGVTGKLSFRIEQRLTREQLLAAFEAVLATNGVALVRNGDQLVITLQSKAKSAASIRSRGDVGNFAGYEVVAIPLSYAQPSEVAKALAAISSDNLVVYQNDRLGLLLLGGSGSQLTAAMETLKIFDQSVFVDSKIRWYELSQAQASTVAAELDRIIDGAGLVGVAVVPLKRLNGVIVFGRSIDALNDLSKWVAKLDTVGKDTGSSMFVYHPRASSAEALARTLGAMLGFQTPYDTSGSVSARPTSSINRPPSDAAPPTDAPMLQQGARTANSDEALRIGVDKDTNTLIVSTSPGQWVQIQRILNEIDRTPRQILIEASILEVTLSHEFQFGIDWSVFSKNLTVGSINSDSGTVGATFPGFSATYLSKNIEASIQALGSRTAVEVVSAPKIIALDNKTARLEVGDQVPVVTQSSQSQVTTGAPVVSSVDYRSTGVILTVTPRITGDDQLTLDVAQEVSSVAKTVTSGIDSPTIQQRRFESTLVMHDGEAIALGGLISSTKTTGDSGVPYLKDAPVVGALFRTSSKQSDRTELIVLLTAKIIKDGPTATTVMQNLLKDMQDLQARGLLPHA